MQRQPAVGWPLRVCIQLSILHNGVNELWAGSELNKVPSDKLDCYRFGPGTPERKDPVTIYCRPCWTGCDAVYASIEEATCKLRLQVVGIAEQTDDCLPQELEPYRDPAIPPVGNDHAPEALTDRPELVVAAPPSGNGTAATEAQDAGPLVILGEPGDQPIVNGRTKNRLTLPRFHVIKALMEAGRDGLSKDELVDRSGHGDAVNILKRLAKSNADWDAVIQLGETPGGRYRISS
jgi:hypothetical protein